jgi:uncharacterized protein YfaS (alpha-2-macroglobulin family)
MKRQNILSWGIMVLIIFAGFLISCNKKNQKQAQPDVTYTEEQAKEISYITSGDIHFDDVIEIYFNNPVVEENEVGSSPKDVFKFSPNIKGHAVWEERNVLKFIPEKTLTGRKSYEGILKLDKLSPSFLERKMEDLAFRFTVLGRDVSSFNGSLELKDRNDPKILIYSGSILFSEKTTLESVQKAVELRGGKNLTLSWSQIDAWNYQFSSSEILRTDKNQNYKIIIDKDPLELEADYTETFVLSPLKKMIANKFRTDEAGRKPRIRITFSDELDMEQNIDGLIQITPAIKFEIKKLGKTIILDGKFKFGKSYNISVQKGIRSRWGSKTESVVSEELQFSNIPPQVEFGSNGIILPTSNKKKIQFYTTNLKRVHLQVKKVFSNQVGNFVHSEQLNSTKTRNRDFKSNYESNVGVIIKNQTIELGTEQNEWILNEFDLSKLFENYNNGLFLIRINFTPEDVAMPIENEDVLQYIVEKGQIYKPVFLSNLGLTVKIADDETYVFVTDILTGKPLSSVQVSLLDYRGESKTSQYTDRQGVTVFDSDDYFYYVLAEQGDQITALNKGEMQWSNSGFDIGGIREDRDRTKGFIYTERGVYRPGDSIHVGFIVKNESNSFPTDHPAEIRVRDPEYNTIYEHTSVESTDGFYVFKFKTDENAPTGNYNISINAGNSWFYEDLKIETVVAEQLKVKINPRKKEFIWTDKTIDFEINANYLFGAPAANLKAEATIEIHPREITFPKFSDFTFTRADVEFKSITQNIFKKDLDSEGNLRGNWYLPALGNVPSALRLKIMAKVLEKGGQPNEGWTFVNKHVYPNYVGLKDPSGYGYFKTGQEVKFPLVLLDTESKNVGGRQLQYRIYRNDKMWWYQYDSRSHYRLRYKEDNQTYLEAEGDITTSKGVNYIGFTPSENGEYLIEVSDGGNGHTASMFFSAYQYGRSSGGEQNEGTLALKSDKAKYAPNETAKIKMPNPKKGNILVTVEKGQEILDWFWVNPANNNSDELLINVPLNSEMLPNVYVTVSVIQPHNQTVNDRPIRMFGIIPILVEDSNTKLNYIISSSENLVPNEDFTIDINTENQKKSQISVAIVDEGLLSLTQFRTPQPWKEFYKKIGLFVESYDVFSHVISANKGDVFQTFSIGGSEEMDYRESQLDPIDGKKRFKPVCMFKGPFYTDNNGHAKLTFHMPNYNGAVRVMVVGTNQSSFGNGEKTIPVRSDIIMQPSIPRILNPGDEFILPVALFNLNPKIKSAQFNIVTEGPLEIISDNKFTVDFSQKSEADIRFKVRVKEAIGQAKITINGSAGNVKVQSETNIKVVPSATRIYDKTTQKVEKEKTISLKVPKVGLEGTNNATLEVSLFPNMDFDHRLKWLIRYPYGCIEQTTSAIFPQLSLKTMGYFRGDEKIEIDKNINEGINRLQLFLLSDGGFSYWPGNTSASEWGSNYATHFLVEAKKMGYAVPDFMYNNALNSLKNNANYHNGHLTTRVNRVFILALANKTSMSEMNILMENNLNNMSSAEKWMLAAAYHLAGAEEIRDKILAIAGTVTVEYDPFSYNYGSKYRDDAIILYCATLMKKMDIAELLAKNVSLKLSSTDYLSTQSSGYMLLALGNYFEAIGINAEKGQVIAGTITLANGTKIDFNEKGRYSVKIKGNFDQNIQCSLSDKSNVDQAFFTLSWNGVPKYDQIEAVEKNLKLNVTWYDESGNTINPQNLKQGATIIGKYSVKNTSPVTELSELALVQIIPSGWAIENTRLNNKVLPSWVTSWNINKEDYMDIRDDRVMWFFDLEGQETLDFIVKINCVNAGDFWLPATLTEAMYNSDFKATTEGKKVHVESFK